MSKTAEQNRIEAFIYSHPRVYSVLKSARTSLGRVVGARQFPEIPGRVHANDVTLPGWTPVARAAYAAAGQSALDSLRAALSEADRTFADVQSCLDFGCGYGRITRWLVRVMPSSRITVTDIDRAAVQFTAAEFGVVPLLSDEVIPTDLGAHDLIWVGSVFTHLPEEAGAALARALMTSLPPGGVLVLTTHGERSLEIVEQFGSHYSEVAPQVRVDVAERGMRFEPYPHYLTENYGVAWHTRDYITELISDVGVVTRPLTFCPAGWSDHQDVHAFQRVD